MSSAELESYHTLNSISRPTSRRVSRLTEVLDFLPENTLLNIDRAWRILPGLLPVLDRYPKAMRQVIIKAPLRVKENF